MPLKASPRLEWPGTKNARYVGRLEEVEKYGYSGPPPTMSPGYTGYSVTDAQFIVLEGKRRTFRGRPVPAGGCSGVRQAAFRDSRRRIIAENPERFRRLKVVNQTRLRNARRFLAGELKATW